MSVRSSTSTHSVAGQPSAAQLVLNSLNLIRAGHVNQVASAILVKELFHDVPHEQADELIAAMVTVMVEQLLPDNPAGLEALRPTLSDLSFDALSICLLHGLRGDKPLVLETKLRHWFVMARDIVFHHASLQRPSPPRVVFLESSDMDASRLHELARVDIFSGEKENREIIGGEYLTTVAALKLVFEEKILDIELLAKLSKGVYALPRLPAASPAPIPPFGQSQGEEMVTLLRGLSLGQQNLTAAHQQLTASQQTSDKRVAAIQTAVATIPAVVDKAVDDAVSRRTRGAIAEANKLILPTPAPTTKDRSQTEKQRKEAEEKKKFVLEKAEKLKNNPNTSSKQKSKKINALAEEQLERAGQLLNKAERSQDPDRREYLLGKAKQKEDLAGDLDDGIATESDIPESEKSSSHPSEDDEGNEKGSAVTREPLDPNKSRRGLYTPEDWPIFLPETNPQAPNNLIARNSSRCRLP